MIIKFKNWSTYQNRKIENTQWFRFENRIIYHDLWDELSGDEFKCFVFMLCESSLNKNSGIYRVNDRTDSRKSGLEKKVFDRTIKKLKELQVIEIRTTHGCYADVSSVITTLHNITEQDITEHNIYVDSPSSNTTRINFDFESAYKEFPRKEGKSRGIILCKAQIKTETDFKLLEQAIRNYRIKKSGTESRYLLMFSTFMGQWRDWLDPETGTALEVKTGLDFSFLKD